MAAAMANGPRLMNPSTPIMRSAGNLFVVDVVDSHGSIAVTALREPLVTEQRRSADGRRDLIASSTHT